MFKRWKVRGKRSGHSDQRNESRFRGAGSALDSLKWMESWFAKNHEAFFQHHRAKADFAPRPAIATKQQTPRNVGKELKPRRYFSGFSSAGFAAAIRQLPRHRPE
jgi:hypothetical protein